MLATDERNQVVRAMKVAFEVAGQPDAAARVKCVNRIPLGNGLGSSSSAIVGGLLLGFRLLAEDPGSDRVLELAAGIEGHPDNAAAAILGGFTVCWTDAGRPRTARFEPARGLAAVVVVGDRRTRDLEGSRDAAD